MITPFRIVRLATVTVVLGAIVHASPVLGQSPMRQGDQRAFDRARVRQMAETRLDEIRSSEAALQEILDMLDTDATDEAIQAKVRAVLRAQGARRERSQEPGARRGAQRGAHEADVDPALLEHIDPRLRERFERMRRENPQRARALLDKAAPRLRRMEKLRKEDPDRFEVRAQSMRAIHDAMRAARAVLDAGAKGLSQDEIDVRRADFHAAVSAAVDSGIALREVELASAESRLGALRAEVESLRETRDEVIRSRAEQMLGGAAREQTDGGGAKRRLRRQGGGRQQR